MTGNYIRPYITANFVQTDAQKQLKAGLSDIILTNQAVAIIYSLEVVFTIAYGLLVHFVSWLAALLIVQWVTCSLLACEVEGLHPGVIFLLHFSFNSVLLRVPKRYGFDPNSILWAFRTIQPSSFNNRIIP